MMNRYIRVDWPESQAYMDSSVSYVQWGDEQSCFIPEDYILTTSNDENLCEKYVCEECGSNDIHGIAWVNLNTQNFVEWDDTQINTVWCGDCEDFTSQINSKEYKK